MPKPVGSQPATERKDTMRDDWKRMDCGCEVGPSHRTDGVPAMVYCPLHAAAPKMLDLLKAALIDDHEGLGTYAGIVWEKSARALLKEVEG